MLLKDISFSESLKSSANLNLENRLRQIRNQIYGSNKTKEYKGGRYIRHVIDAKDFGWINEIQIETEQKDNEKFLVVKMFVGDTKQQGKVFFQKNPSGIRQSPTICGYKTTVEPYLRFAHYDSTIFSLFLNSDEGKKTHSIEFFNSYAGKHKRENWQDIKNIFNKYLPNWNSQCDWKREFEDSNRNYFDLAMGTLLTVQLPYEECQNLDDSEKDSALVILLRRVINELRKMIDKI